MVALSFMVTNNAKNVQTPSISRHCGACRVFFPLNKKSKFAMFMRAAIFTFLCTFCYATRDRARGQNPLGPLRPSLTRSAWKDSYTVAYDVFHLGPELRACCSGVQSRAFRIAIPPAPNSPPQLHSGKSWGRGTLTRVTTTIVPEDE